MQLFFSHYFIVLLVKFNIHYNKRPLYFVLQLDFSALIKIAYLAFEIFQDNYQECLRNAWNAKTIWQIGIAGHTMIIYFQI